MGGGSARPQGDGVPPGAVQASTVSLLGRWSVMTYEAPKQSPPALKEEEDGDSNIQVGTSGDGGALGGMRQWHEVSVAGLSLATCPRPAAKRGGVTVVRRGRVLARGHPPWCPSPRCPLPGPDLPLR